MKYTVLLGLLPLFAPGFGAIIPQPNILSRSGCGANIGGNLARVINQLIQDLPPIIQDAKNSQIKPSAAYSVFFKKSRNAPFISQLLTNVTTGAIMRPPVVPFTKGGPTFLCPRPGQTFEMQLPYGVIDAAEYCAGRDTPVAGCLQGTPYIMLCSKFFSGVAGPQTPPVGVCPRVNNVINKFRRSPTDDNNVGDTIIHNQMWILLEEIVHYYLFNQPNLKETIPEVYDINKAWHLSAKKSKRNAASYGYYAGTVHNKCDDWPEGSGRELLEVDLSSFNTTEDVPNASGVELGGALEVLNINLSADNHSE